MAETFLDLIRHGEPVGGRRYRGQIDDPLSERGWQQMRRTVADSRPWQAIVSSPLLRCQAFAREMADRHSLPLQHDDRLMEIGFGEWEGLTAEQIEHSYPGSLMAFYRDPVSNRPEGAESLDDFRTRVAAALKDLLENYPDQRLLVVAHAGVIRMLMLLALDLPVDSMYRIRVDNASITRLQVTTGTGQPPYCQLLSHGLAFVPE